ncbi:MAG: insulinase family protein [Polyangiaceae bacterium]|nr:insulinase family protein [Polyangiaceae bacterium]
MKNLVSLQTGRVRALIAGAFAAALTLAACTEPVMTPPPPFPTSTPPTTSASASAAPAALPDSIDNKPVLAAPRAFESPKPEVVKLPNGMTLWLLERHTLPLVAVSLTVPSGSSSDPLGKEGLASITADMLDEGAGARSAIEVSTALQDLGVSLRTGVTMDGSAFSLTVLKKNFGAAFNILSDVIARPRFEEKEWKRVSDLWKNALLKRADDPNTVARLVTQIAVYGRSHPYGHTTDGFMASAGNVDLNAVKAFHAAHYRPENMVLSVVGDITKDEITRFVSDAFGAWKASAPAPEPTAFPAPVRGPSIVLVDRPDAPQSVIAVVRDGIRLQDADAPYYELVNTALGGSFTSRLNQNLREDHGWTYGAGSYFSETKRGGVFGARAAVETKFTEPALTEMLKELRLMASKGLTEDELAKVKSQDRADLVQAYETVGGVAGRFGTLSILGLPASFDAVSSATRQSASLDGLKKIAAAVDPAKCTIIVVGPRKDVQGVLQKLGPVEHWDPEGNPVKVGN